MPPPPFLVSRLIFTPLSPSSTCPFLCPCRITGASLTASFTNFPSFLPLCFPFPLPLPFLPSEAGRKVMDLALAEAGQGLAAQELALDFLPGLACAAAYACGPSSAPSQPSGQGKEKEKEKTPREKDNKGPSPHHSSSHKDKASSDKASSSGRRAGNVKLAPVPSPELLGALADLTAHMRRFHTSQVGSTSRTRSYILSFHSLITDTHRRSYHCTHLLTRPPAHLFTPDLPTTHPSTHPPTHPPTHTTRSTR